jgi:hypothetical protein
VERERFSKPGLIVLLQGITQSIQLFWSIFVAVATFGWDRGHAWRAGSCDLAVSHERGQGFLRCIRLTICSLYLSRLTAMRCT